MPTTRSSAALQSKISTTSSTSLPIDIKSHPYAPYIAYRTRCCNLEDPDLLQKALSLPKGEKGEITGKDLTPVEVLSLLRIDRLQRQYYASTIYCPRGMFRPGNERFVCLDDDILEEAGVPRDVIPRMQHDRRDISDAGWRQRCLEDRAILEGTWYGEGQYARRSITGGVSGEETPPAWIAKEMGWSRRKSSAVPVSPVVNKEAKKTKSIKFAGKVICRKMSRPNIHKSTVTTRKRNIRNRKSSSTTESSHSHLASSPIAPSSIEQPSVSPTSSTWSSIDATPELFQQQSISSLSFSTRASLRSSENPSNNTMSSPEGTPSQSPKNSQMNKVWEAKVLGIQNQSEDESEDETPDSEVSSKHYTPNTASEASPSPSDTKSTRRLNKEWDSTMLDMKYGSEDMNYDLEDEDKDDVESDDSQVISKRHLHPGAAIRRHFPKDFPKASAQTKLLPSINALEDFPVRWSIRILADGTAASEAVAHSPTKTITVSSSQYSMVDVQNAIMEEFEFGGHSNLEVGIRVLRLRMLSREGRWNREDVTEENFDAKIRPLLDEAGKRNHYGQTMYLEFGI